VPIPGLKEAAKECDAVKEPVLTELLCGYYYASEESGREKCESEG
jgi:hypothetical protein